jgi:hypothetical protein
VRQLVDDVGYAAVIVFELGLITLIVMGVVAVGVIVYREMKWGR